MVSLVFHQKGPSDPMSKTTVLHVKPRTQEIVFDGIHSACRHPIKAHPTVRELPKLPTRTRFLLVNMHNIFSYAGNEHCLGNIPARMELA